MPAMDAEDPWQDLRSLRGVIIRMWNVGTVYPIAHSIEVLFSFKEGRRGLGIPSAVRRNALADSGNRLAA